MKKALIVIISMYKAGIILKIQDKKAPIIEAEAGKAGWNP